MGLHSSSLKLPTEKLNNLFGVQHIMALRRQVDADAFAELTETAHLERYGRNKILWHDDMNAPLHGLLLDGYLRLQRCSYDGRRQILNMTLPGEFLGQESENPSGYTLETSTEATIWRFDTAVVDRLLAENHSFRQALYRAHSEKLDRLRWLTLAIGILRPSERLCAFLAVAPRFLPYQPLPDGGGILKVTVGRRDIADLLATSVESVCRILKDLERRGVIELRGPSLVRIIDPVAVAAEGLQTSELCRLVHRENPAETAANTPHASKQEGSARKPMTGVNERAAAAG